MRIRQAVPPLARGSPEELGAEQRDQQRARADGRHAATSCADGRTPATRFVAPRVMPLRHHENEQDREGEDEPATNDDRDAQVDRRERDARGQADDSRDLPELSLAEKQRIEAAVAALAGDPRLERAMSESLAEPAQDLEADDGDEDGDETLTYPGDADDRGASDDGHAAAERVGEHARRDLPDEVGRLERRADQHELEWIKMRHGDVIEEPCGGDERPPEAAPRPDEQIDGPRG